MSVMQGMVSGRRLFLRRLARETLAGVDEARGILQLRLVDLPALPDEQLSRLTPVILPQVKILDGGSEVRAQRPGERDTIVLFPSGGVEQLLFNRFNGRNSLGEIASEMGMPQAFALTRAFFLKLVRLQVCVPANPPT